MGQHFLEAAMSGRVMKMNKSVSELYQKLDPDPIKVPGTAIDNCVAVPYHYLDKDPDPATHLKGNWIKIHISKGSLSNHKSK